MKNFSNTFASLVPGFSKVPFPLRGAVLARMFVSTQHGFIYHRIPKTGNSTVTTTLAAAMGYDTKADRGMAQRAGSGPHALWALASRRDAAMFRFTFVRNPYARILSTYLDKIGTEEPKFMRRLDARGPLSFLAFLERLDGGYLNRDPHWAPQASLLPVRPDELDFVGRTERLSLDLEAVLRRIFAGAHHEIIRSGPPPTHASERAANLYGPRERGLVEKMYERDFEAFYAEQVAQVPPSGLSSARPSTA